MILSVIALVSLVWAHPFGLDFEDEDRSYGHHGKPAEYKAMDGIVHPWAKNKVVMDPMEAMLAELFVDDDSFGMMDLLERKEPKKAEFMDDDMAMLTIMESTPEMCPLCAKEGHALGHDDHKKLLAKLREKLVLDTNKKRSDGLLKSTAEEDLMTLLSCDMCQAEGSTHNHKDHHICPMCQAEGSVKNHEMHECPLCQAEGSMMHHEKHIALLKLAKELEWEKPKEKHFGCKLCNTEGTDRNHSKHLELAAALKKKISMEKKAPLDILRQQQAYSAGLKRIIDIVDEHRDRMVASMAEAQLARDRKNSPSLESGLIFEYVFDEQDKMFTDFEDDDMFMAPFEPFEMMKMVRSDPPRDFRRRAGEPADEIDEDEDESLIEKIIRNIRDLLGMDSMSTSSKEEDSDQLGEFGGILAMLLLLFVGLLLVSFGMVELISAIFGEKDTHAGYKSLDADERMILDMEDGTMTINRESTKGSISL